MECQYFTHEAIVPLTYIFDNKRDLKKILGMVDQSIGEFTEAEMSTDMGNDAGGDIEDLKSFINEESKNMNLGLQ